MRNDCTRFTKWYTAQVSVILIWFHSPHYLSKLKCAYHARSLMRSEPQHPHAAKPETTCEKIESARRVLRLGGDSTQNAFVGWAACGTDRPLTVSPEKSCVCERVHRVRLLEGLINHSADRDGYVCVWARA